MKPNEHRMKNKIDVIHFFHGYIHFQAKFPNQVKRISTIII